METNPVHPIGEVQEIAIRILLGHTIHLAPPDCLVLSFAESHPIAK